MINASTNDCKQKNYLNKLNKHLKENRLIELVKIMINGYFEKICNLSIEPLW